MINTYPVGIGFTEQNCVCFSKFQHFTGYFRNYWTNTRHVGTYLNAFLMVIPNMVMKFNSFDICYKICYIFDMSAAW